MGESLANGLYVLNLFDKLDSFETKQFRILLSYLEDFLKLMEAAEEGPKCNVQRTFLWQKSLSDDEKSDLLSKTKNCVLKSEELRTILAENNVINDKVVTVLMSYVLMKTRNSRNEADWPIFMEFKQLFDCLFDLRKFKPLENLDSLIIKFAEQLIEEIKETPKDNYVDKVRLVNVMAKMLIEIGSKKPFNIPLLKLVMKEIQIYFRKLSKLKPTQLNNCFETEAYLIFLKVISDLSNPKITIELKEDLDNLRQILKKIVDDKKVSPHVAFASGVCLEKVEVFLSLIKI